MRDVEYSEGRYIHAECSKDNHDPVMLLDCHDRIRCLALERPPLWAANAGQKAWHKLNNKA